MIDEALVLLVVVQNLLFSIVEWPEFYTICQALNLHANDMIPKVYSTIKTKIMKAFQDHLSRTEDIE